MQFKDITGQIDVKQKMLESVKQGRIPHAQLLLGPAGSPKLGLAIAYAQYLLCEDPGPEDSCGQCAACHKAGQLIHPDLHFSFPFINKKTEKKTRCVDYLPEWREAVLENVDMDTHEWLRKIGTENQQGNITVTEAQHIIQTLSLKSFESERKILVMWMPEYLGAAGNVLLKIIEEPPQGTIFLLVAEKADHILSTILSRTQLLKIPSFLDEEVSITLQNKLKLDKQSSDNISRIAAGNITKALQIASEEGGNEPQLIQSWFKLLMEQDSSKHLSWIEDFAKLGRENQKNFMNYVLHFIEAAIRIELGISNSSLHEDEFLLARKLGSSLGLNQWELMSNKVNDAAYHIERNANPKILMLNLGIELAKIINLQVAKVAPETQNS